jgi:hypothetical protein
MPEPVRKVQRYRQCAQQLRTIALDWIGHPDFGVLVKIASDYERLADQEGHVDNLGPQQIVDLSAQQAMRLRLQSGSNG